MNLKKLEKELKTIENSLAEQKRIVTAAQKKCEEIKRQRAGAQEKVRLAQEVPRVSDHAIVRLLEREYGYNIDGLKEQILNNQNIAAINSGCTKIKVNNLSFVVQGKCVVTCV